VRAGRNRPGLLDYVETPDLLFNPRYAKDGPEFEKASETRAEFEKRNSEEDRKERKRQQAQAQAERYAAEYAESRELDWANDPSGFKNNAFIGRLMEKGEEFGEKVRPLGQGLLPRTDGSPSVYNDKYLEVASQEEKKPSLKVSGDFTAAKKFDGPRKGYVFTSRAKGKGYYRKSDDDDDQYVVKPTLFAPIGVEKGAESAAGDKYWTYAIPFLGEERRAGQRPATKAVPAGPEPLKSRYGAQQIKRIFGQRVEGDKVTPEEEKAAALREAYEKRTKDEKKVKKEEKKPQLEQGTVVLSPDPRDALRELGPIDKEPSDKQDSAQEGA